MESNNYLGNLYRITGKYREAEKHIKQAIEIADRLASVEPRSPLNQTARANTYYYGGLFLITTGRAAQAEKPFQLARDIADNLCEVHPAVVDHSELLARVLNGLAVAQREMGAVSKATESNEKALGLCQRLVEGQPRVGWNRFLRARVRQHLGILYRESGRIEEARAAYRQALDDCAKIVANYPEDATFAMTLGFMYATQADLHRDLGESVQALNGYERAIGQLDAALDREVLHVDRQDYISLARAGRAVTLAQTGKYAAAKKVLSELPKPRTERFARQFNLATILVEAHEGDYVAAEEKADDLSKRKGVVSGRAFFDLACAHALCATAASKDAKIGQDQRRRRAENSAAKAVGLLRAAQTAHYFQTNASLKRLANEPALSSLRSRQDFKQLLQEMQPK